MKKVLWTLCLIVIAVFVVIPDVQAQDSDWFVSGANYARYYHFKETKEDSAATRFQFDIYMGNFSIGAWYEAKHLMNSEFGNYTTNKLTQRFFRWEDAGLSIQAGNFYQVFDRGLILNTFIDEDVGIDMVLDGLQINWREKYFDLDVISATEGIGDPSFGAKPIIRGSRFKFKPLKQLHLGGAYVGYIDFTRTNLKQVNARINFDYIDGYVEYAKRNFHIPDPDDFTNTLGKTGDGTYATVTGYQSLDLAFFGNLQASGFFEYKNYKFLTFDGENTLNLPPAVNRQDRSIQAEASNYFVPYSSITGERGYRGNMTLSWSDYWGIEADYAKAYSRDSVNVHIFEYFLGIRGNYWKDNTFYINVDYFDHTIKDETRWDLEFDYFLNDLYSVTVLVYMIDYELIDSAEVYMLNDFEDYTEKNLDITFSRTPDLDLTIGGSISDNDHSKDPKRKLAYIKLVLTLGNHELEIFHGGLRGGLVCSGGVCKYQEAFEGLRVSVLSRF